MALFMVPIGSETSEAFDARARNELLTWKDFVKFKTRTPSNEPPGALSGLSPLSIETLDDGYIQYQFSEKDAKEIRSRYYSGEEDGM
jgi:hypothetical protein